MNGYLMIVLSVLFLVGLGVLMWVLTKSVFWTCFAVGIVVLAFIICAAAIFYNAWIGMH